MSEFLVHVLQLGKQHQCVDGLAGGNGYGHPSDVPQLRQCQSVELRPSGDTGRNGKRREVGELPGLGDRGSVFVTNDPDGLDMPAKFANPVLKTLTGILLQPRVADDLLVAGFEDAVDLVVVGLPQQAVHEDPEATQHDRKGRGVPQRHTPADADPPHARSLTE